MSKKATTAITLAAIVIGWGVFYFLRSAQAPAENAAPGISITANNPASSENGGSVQTENTPAVNSPDGTGSASGSGTSPNDASDPALDQDLGHIDSQMKNLDSDAKGIDGGINDQPIATE
jgi:hypothetical protein